MKKEELDIASEKIIFFMVLNYPEKVLKIPKGLYEKFKDLVNSFRVLSPELCSYILF